MRHITLGSLLLGLDDLLTKRSDALQSFDAGKASLKFLSGRRDKITALPAELTGRPHADLLAATDARHDGFGGVVWFVTEAYLRHPGSTPDMIEAAKKIRAAFITSLDDLRARYVDEATAAKAHEPSLETLKAELEMFPMAGGQTLYECAVGFVEAGKRIDELLSDRADAKDRRAATVLRGETLAKLNRLRNDLADALKDEPTLPADLDAQVFGYFDLLEKKDAEAAAEEKKKEAVRKEEAAKKEAAKAAGKQEPAKAEAPAAAPKEAPAPEPARAPAEGGAGSP